MMTSFAPATLAAALQRQRPTQAQMLDFATALARLLAGLHANGQIHGDIHPCNILVRGWRDPALQRELSGRLEYIAPEQTGRTGRSVDERADLYALGAVLYELATGRPPFASTDPLQLIHDHLVRQPVAPADLDAGIPEGLSQVILRLLAKEPEQRYQSAEGLAHDLGRLRDGLRDGEAATFVLGDHDFAARLAAPPHPVGRERELAALRAAFEDALRGGARGVLVGGPPGVGKSALIAELRPLVAARGGWFVTGKFDAQRQDLASDGMYQCLRALGRLLLAEPEEELQLLRTRLLEAVGPVGCRLFGAVPEFVTLLGAQPDAAAPSDPINTKQMMVEATLELLRTVASPERPLVLALDDLQWAAPLPVAGVHAVLTDNRARGLFLVCSYRDAGLDPGAPLAAMLPRWQQLAPAPLALRIRNLDAQGMATLLGEMLRLGPADAARLAPLIQAHTDGNPFDTVELLEGLRREHALVLGDQGWTWDSAAIPRHVAQGSVQKMLAERVAKLPPDTRAVVDVLACLGGAVELPLLECALDLPAAALLQRLGVAAQEGLVQLPQEGQPALRFSHDRVQQASFERLAADGARERLHLQLARRLALHPRFESAAAHQYLPVLDAIEDAAERRRVVELLGATATALRPYHASAADRLLVGALALLERAGAAPQAMVPLQIERHAGLYALGRLAEANEVYAVVAQHCTDPLQLVEAACVQVSSLTNQGRPADAVALGAAVLPRLGAALPGPEQMGPMMSQGSSVLFGRWLDPGSVAADLQRAAASDPYALAAGRLLERMTPASFFCDPGIFASMVLAGHGMWVQHGPAAEFVGLLSHVSFLSIGAWGDYGTGRSVARAVLQIADARGWTGAAAHSRFLYTLGMLPWSENLEQGIALAHQAHEGLLAAGDLQYACFVFYASLYPMLECAPLERYAAESERALALSGRTGNDHAGAAYVAHRQLARAMRGETASLASFEDADFSESAHEAAVRGNRIAMSNYCTARAVAAAVAGDLAAAGRHAAAGLATEAAGAIYPTALQRVMHGLALADRMRGLAGAERTACLQELEACRGWLAQRAADAPANFQHFVQWLDAERAWAEDDFRAASIAFDTAVQTCDAVMRPWHRALIAERAGRFLLANDMRRTGERTLVLARRCYAAWGASAKLRGLDAEFPFLRGAVDAREDGAAAAPALPVQSIDMLGLLRASQALSSETNLESLKRRVAELLVSMTGATSVQLALWNADSKQWLVSASSAGALATLPVEGAGKLGMLPLSAFRYAERTLEPVLVEDTSHDDRFARDPYFETLGPGSLLVFPILSQGAPRAMLLLENRLSRAAFSADRLDALRLIAGQLAVSLENALLYEQLEQRVQERTRELRSAQAELLDTARRAGMAEIATNVLHNVGNILNSVNISANLVTSRLRGSRLQGLQRAVEMLDAHDGDLANFLTRDEKGRLLPGYLSKSVEALGAEREEVVRELAHLVESVDHIKNVVATQQSYAGHSGLIEAVSLPALVEDALRIHAGALQRTGITIAREFGPVPTVHVDKTRVMQILVNLIGNAVQAMEDLASGRQLTLRVEQAGLGVRISVIDRGVGISADNLARVFTHGFTTRANGHGFGLHSCALAARQMHGTLTASSAGPGQGATFVLELPAGERAVP